MSDPYTPTTEEVREAYAEDDVGVPRPKYYPEFDRWLASVKAEAWKEGYGVGFENGLDLESHNARGIGPF